MKKVITNKVSIIDVSLVKRNSKALSVFLIVIIFSACDFSFEKGENKEEISDNELLNIGLSYELNFQTIQLVSNESISFCYALSKDTVFKNYDFIEISCTLVNNSIGTVFYVCGSCNRLAYYLVSEPDIVEVWPEMMCNASFPMIEEL